MRSESLAGAFFLIAHDAFDGRLALSPELLGCGLVGAELADLILARRLRVEDNGMLVVANPEGGFTGIGPLEEPDEVDEFVIRTVRSQSLVHTVRAWVEPLQDGLYELISRGLVDAGVVRQEHGPRRLGRSRQPARFPAEDLLAATRPQQQLRELLARPVDLTLRVGILAALVNALGIEKLLDLNLDRTVQRELLDEIDQNLPTDLKAVCEVLRAVTTEVSVRST
jgi:Golgi phosphoprotein 3 (GPP34)